jgi:hypothetical protein
MVITTSHLMVIIDPWVLYLQKEYEYYKMIQKLTSSRITDTNIPSLTEATWAHYKRILALATKTYWK